MRACFLGQNVCALGFGVAMVQTPPLHEPEHETEDRTPVPQTPPENLMAREFRRAGGQIFTIGAPRP